MNKNNLISIIFLGLLGAFFARASFADEFPKVLFLALFQEDFSQGFCADNGIGGACFNLPNKECVKISDTAYLECVKILSPQIPENISTQYEAWSVGAKIGMCVSRKFRLENSAHSNYTQSCNAILNKVFKGELPE